MNSLRNILIYVILLCTTFELWAQNDSIAISESGTWIVWNSEATQVWDPITQTYIWVGVDSYKFYQVNGDTTIAGYNYKKLYSATVYYDNISSFSASIFLPTYVLAFRNDYNNRAYRVMPGMINEELWYNFNTSLGDTIFSSTVFPYNPSYTVTNIDTTVKCDSSYRWFHYNGIAGYFSGLNCVQKFGSTRNFINYNSSNLQFDSLMFFCENIDSLSQVEVINPVGISDNESVLKIDLYPNPATHTLFFDPLPSFGGFIYNLYGKQLMRIEENQSSADISHLAPGVYCFQIIGSGLRSSTLFVKN